MVACKCVKVFKNGLSKKKFKGYGQAKADHTPSNFLKAAFHKLDLVDS